MTEMQQMSTTVHSFSVPPFKPGGAQRGTGTQRTRACGFLRDLAGIRTGCQKEVRTVRWSNHRQLVFWRLTRMRAVSVSTRFCYTDRAATKGFSTRQAGTLANSLIC